MMLFFIWIGRVINRNLVKEDEDMPQYEIKYIELKTGYRDDGPAWIGRVKKSKSGNTIYFNNKAFQKHIGTNSNFFDVESGDGYWISGIKKDGCDRHWTGKGKITIDQKIIPEYLSITGEKELDLRRFVVVDIVECFPEERIHGLQNAKNTMKDA